MGGIGIASKMSKNEHQFVKGDIRGTNRFGVHGISMKHAFGLGQRTGGAVTVTASGVNCLVIPEGLEGFAEAKAVMRHGRNAIYHKRVYQSALDVEFYNTGPCLCFVMHGCERFLTPSGEEIVVQAGEMILLPRNVHMISNFCNSNGPLEAFLCFFDQTTIAEFEKRSPRASGPQAKSVGSYKIDAHESFTAYMESLTNVYRGLKVSQDLLRNKLTELLYLIQTLDCAERQSAFLRENNEDTGKRNIRYLMQHHMLHNLTVSDFAKLSGRSVSSFTREFKRQFDTTPAQWLIGKRMEHARAALLTSDASIGEIGTSVGYDNPSHFISQFRKRFGTTPSRMRGENM